jgi:putative alpha-1,2-mannosidase
MSNYQSHVAYSRLYRFNNATDANAGYTPDGNVTAISMMHESGTGGSPKYGVVPQMPLTTLEGVNLMDNMTYMQPRVGNDTANIGLYTTKISNGVQIDMTSSMHAGLLQYTFPSSSNKYILVDLSHYLPTQDDHMASQFYSNGRIELSDGGSSYSGYGTWRGGWNEGPDYTLYFCAKFDSKPLKSQLFQGPYTGKFQYFILSMIVIDANICALDPDWPGSTSAKPEFVNVSSITAGPQSYSTAHRIGALFTFPSQSLTIKSKVGVSWLSKEKACDFLNELPTWDLDITAASAAQTWEDGILSQIEIKDTRNTTLLTMFYSALYRTALLPSNRTGENPFWDDGVPYFDDICKSPSHFLV